MNPWEMLGQALNDPNVPYKIEVGEYSVARKPAAKGKSGEPALPPGQYGYEMNKGGKPYLSVPPAERQRYIYDNKGILWDMLSGQPAQRATYDRREQGITLATPTPIGLPTPPASPVQEIKLPEPSYRYNY